MSIIRVAIKRQSANRWGNKLLWTRPINHDILFVSFMIVSFMIVSFMIVSFMIVSFMIFSLV